MRFHERVGEGFKDLAQASFRRVAHTSYAATMLGPRREFAKRIQNPEKYAALKLKQILARNRDTEFGRDHRFDRIDSIHEFQSRVPVRGFEELSSYVGRAAEGRSRVLTSDDVIAFERTSGSSSFSKLIPYTRPFLAELEEATSAWLGDLLVRHPRLIGGKSYWSISPIVRRGDPVTKGGIPIGMESDLDYFNPLARAMMNAMMVKPRLDVLHSGDDSHGTSLPSRLEEWRLETAAALLATPELGFISVWSPTFMFPIIDTILNRWEEVIPLVNSRARRVQLDHLRDSFETKGVASAFFADVWPDLHVVSCWSDGPSVDSAMKLETLLPSTTTIEGKGLLATEGVVTIPFSGAPDPVVAVGSHFLEFIDLERPDSRPRLPHELKTGGLYSPLMTTSGGLYRYHLRDVLYCTGRNAETPTLRFRGRLDKTSDLCGEKLDAAQVERAFEIACNTVGFRPDFFLLAPDFDGPLRYRAFIETSKSVRMRHELVRYLEVFEKALKQNPHYAYALDLKQLLPMEATPIERGVETWEAFMLRQGHRLGDLKLARLDSKYNWREIFHGVARKDLVREIQAANRVDDAAVPVAP